MTRDAACWQPIETAPQDGTVVILANFEAMCLLTHAPHVWTARWEPHLGDGGGWCECSYAAINENGEPTHWTSLPATPGEAVDRLERRLRGVGAPRLLMH